METPILHEANFNMQQSTGRRGKNFFRVLVTVKLYHRFLKLLKNFRMIQMYLQFLGHRVQRESRCARRDSRLARGW